MNEQEVKEGIGVIEEKSEATKKDGEVYWKYKIVLDGVGSPLTFSQWSFEEGKEVRTGTKVKLFWTEKQGTGFEGKPVTYRNINSIGPTEVYETSMAGQSDEQLAKQAPKESLKDKVHKESRGGVGETLTTNQSIVRQVLYKVASELLVKGTPAKEINDYVKELEKGFYGK